MFYCALLQAKFSLCTIKTNWTEHAFACTSTIIKNSQMTHYKLTHVNGIPLLQWPKWAHFLTPKMTELRYVKTLSWLLFTFQVYANYVCMVIFTMVHRNICDQNMNVNIFSQIQHDLNRDFNLVSVRIWRLGIERSYCFPDWTPASVSFRSLNLSMAAWLIFSDIMQQLMHLLLSFQLSTYHREKQLSTQQNLRHQLSDAKCIVAKNTGASRVMVIAISINQGTFFTACNPLQKPDIEKCRCWAFKEYSVIIY